VVAVVSLDGGHYRGSAAFKQSNFGISPERIAGGTVKVKDEVKIEFDIVPVQFTFPFALAHTVDPAPPDKIPYLSLRRRPETPVSGSRLAVGCSFSSA
jgi:hypothetical protein